MDQDNGISRTSLLDVNRRCHLAKYVEERALGSEITGFVARRERHFYGRDFVELLFVEPAHRRKGVGGSLMRRTLADAATSRVFTSTNQSNEAMQTLLRSGDWVLSGILVGLDEGDPEHVFFHDVP